MRIYISGQITGTNDYMERFSEVEEKLKEEGHSVMNPAAVNSMLPHDTTYEEYMKMFQNGTHFNPVDLVCAIKNYKGEAFNLPDYVDKTTGFISSKSKNGRELEALELPGLWNGAMSDWNTIFVEVPLSTFNPVKTVNDLLREQHQ